MYPASQILLTGWINADEGTSLSTMLEIDGIPYSEADIEELGGNVELHRVLRNISDIDASMRGGLLRDARAGFILEMNLPFLENGSHSIAVTCNLALPEQDPQLIDLAPIEIIVDNSKASIDGSAEAIMLKWNPATPEPTVNPEQ